jgi:hypothetical protein
MGSEIWVAITGGALLKEARPNEARRRGEILQTDRGRIIRPGRAVVHQAAILANAVPQRVQLRVAEQALAAPSIPRVRCCYSVHEGIEAGFP